MSVNLQEAVNQFQHLPHFEDPAMLGAIAAGPVLTYLGYRLAAHRGVQKLSEDHPDAEGLNLVLDTAPNRSLKSGTVRRTIVGLGALAAAALYAANPVYEEAVPQPTENAVIVLDVSNSMAKTTDMPGGVTRLAASDEGLDEAIDHTSGNLQMSIIAFGKNRQLEQAYTSNHKLLKDTLANLPLPVNAEAGDAADAIDDAVKLFPDHNAGTHNTVELISDGTVDNVAIINQRITAANAKNVSIEVIVPGQTNATYKDNDFSTPITSGIRPDSYAAAGGSHVHVATTEAGIARVSKQILRSHNVSTKHEKHPWKPATWLLEGTGLLAVAALMKENVKEFVLQSKFKRNKRSRGV